MELSPEKREKPEIFESPGTPGKPEDRPDADPIAALLELATTSPRFLGVEGLYYCDQIGRVAVRAGLKVPPRPSLEDIVTRRGTDPFSTDGAADPIWCPLPGEHDLVPVSELREALCAALFEADGTPRTGLASDGASEQLTAAALEYGLAPALTPDGVMTVLSTRVDLAGRLASKLVPAAMSLVADGLMLRLRRCSDPWCRAPFLDRTRNGIAASCSRSCSERARKRRQRWAA